MLGPVRIVRQNENAARRCEDESHADGRLLDFWPMPFGPIQNERTPERGSARGKLYRPSMRLIPERVGHDYAEAGESGDRNELAGVTRPDLPEWHRSAQSSQWIA